MFSSHNQDLWSGFTVHCMTELGQNQELITFNKDAFYKLPECTKKVEALVLSKPMDLT